MNTVVANILTTLGGGIHVAELIQSRPINDEN